MSNKAESTLNRLEWNFLIAYLEDMLSQSGIKNLTIFVEGSRDILKTW